MKKKFLKAILINLFIYFLFSTALLEYDLQFWKLEVRVFFAFLVGIITLFTISFPE